MCGKQQNFPGMPSGRPGLARLARQSINMSVHNMGTVEAQTAPSRDSRREASVIHTPSTALPPRVLSFRLQLAIQHLEFLGISSPGGNVSALPTEDRSTILPQVHRLCATRSHAEGLRNPAPKSHSNN